MGGMLPEAVDINLGIWEDFLGLSWQHSVSHRCLWVFFTFPEQSSKTKLPNKLASWTGYLFPPTMWGQKYFFFLLQTTFHAWLTRDLKSFIHLEMWFCCTVVTFIKWFQGVFKIFRYIYCGLYGTTRGTWGKKQNVKCNESCFIS